MSRHPRISHSLRLGTTFDIEIHDLGHSGEGVGRIDGIPIFVPGGLIGELITVTIDAVFPNYCRGSVLSILQKSPYRVAPPCPVYGICGGCQLQHLGYPQQLEWKRDRVRNALCNIGKLPSVEVRPVIGLDDPFQYRNKVLVPLAKDPDGNTVAGFFKPGSHDVVPMNGCLIQDFRFNSVIETVLSFLDHHHVSVYDERTHTGIARSILARASETELGVYLIINAEQLPFSDEFIAALRGIPEISGIGIIVNKERTNVPVTDHHHCLFGNLDVTSRFGTLALTSPAHRFFQVNYRQTETLLKTVKRAITGFYPVVFDLYCGVGTLGLSIAAQCGQLFGNEISAVATEYAQKNAVQNGFSNCTFVHGDAATVTGQWTAEGLHPDLVIVDPPRKGCSLEMIQLLVHLKPREIIYVSCDPATLARDLRMLAVTYTVDWIQPIDMFPQTAHVESVAFLSFFKLGSIDHES